MRSQKKLPDQAPELQVLLDRLKGLEHEERIIIGLYFYESLTVEEIAAIVNQQSEQITRLLQQIYPKLLNDSSIQSQRGALKPEMLR